MAAESKQPMCVHLTTLLALLVFAATLSAAAPPMTSLYRAPTLLRSGRALTVHGDHNAIEERVPDIAKSLKDAVKRLKKPTPDELFTKFRVDEVKSDLLASNQFRAWTNAVAKTNKKAPQVTNRLIAATLAARFGDDVLVRMLQAAKEVEGVSSTATNLEKGLLAQWRVKHYTMDDVFKLLKLDQEGDKLLTSPLFNTWATYSELLHTNSYWSMKSMAQVLRTHYDDEFPVGLIATGWYSDAENARTLSRDLGNILFRKWMERELHEGKAFEEIKLIGTPLHELIKSPKFGMWVDYVERLQIRLGNDRRAVRELREHYDILELAGAFTMAKAATSAQGYTADMRALASKLQEQVFKEWSTGGMTPQFLNTIRSSDTGEENAVREYAAVYLKHNLKVA